MNAQQVSIRRATQADLPSLVAFLRHMLADMEAVGGHPVSADPEPWAEMQAEFEVHLQVPGYVHLLAETGGADAAAIGWAFARSQDPDPLFEPVRVLHIHALYVSPAHRRRGTGRALLEALLEWGRGEGCVQAELNVLVGNPARALYNQLGFDAFEIEMTRRL